MVTERTRDRRVQRTRRLLHQALMSCILEKKYESITVQDILDRADVGRSTFYTHFRDKDELLISGLQHLKGLLQTAQATSVAPPGKSYEKIIGFSRIMFEHAYEHRELHRALVGSGAEIVVRRLLHSFLSAAVSQEIKTTLQKGRRGHRVVTPELLTHFLVSTYMSVVTWWLKTKNPVPPKDIDAAYRQLVLPSLASILG